MDSPENLVPQDDEKQHKNTMQYELDTTMRKQAKKNVNTTLVLLQTTM